MVHISHGGHGNMLDELAKWYYFRTEWVVVSKKTGRRMTIRPDNRYNLRNKQAKKHTVVHKERIKEYIGQYCPICGIPANGRCLDCENQLKRIREEIKKCLL
jgi:hypothetical protein